MVLFSVHIVRSSRCGFQALDGSYRAPRYASATINDFRITMAFVTSSNDKISEKTPTRRRSSDLLIVGGVAVLVVMGLFARFGEVILDSQREPEVVDVVFAGNFASYVEDYESLFADLDLLPQNLFVFGGDAIWDGSAENESLYADAVSGAQDMAGAVMLVPGDRDRTASVFDSHERSGFTRLGDVIVIGLDTTVQTLGEESCGVDDAQLEMLRSAVAEPATHRIVVMHHAIWTANDYIETLRPNATQECAGDYWETSVVPIIENKVDLVISGDGGVVTTFGTEDRDGITYVLSGSPVHERVTGGSTEGGRIDMHFLRIRIDGNGVVIAPDKIGAPSLVDESVLREVPTYRVSVPEERLVDQYAASPMYPLDLNWALKIEPESVLESIARPIDGVLHAGSEELPIELTIRGNVGNHWEAYKKSWDVDFVATDDRQLKFVRPDDRAFVSQMFVQSVSEHMGVPTPQVSVARLIVNDHDFGIYLVYEDIDKIFLELNGYSSDTSPSKNRFRDHYDAYPATEAFANVVVGGDKGDKSEQQLVVASDLTSEHVNAAFDRDMFARWLAVSAFLGDRHQTTADNFRFFLDRATGRYLMITWDAYLSTVDPENPGTWDDPLIEAFLQDPENEALVRHYVGQLIDVAPELRGELEALVEEWGPVFRNDPAMTADAGAIDRSLQALLGRFDHNLAALEGFVK